MPPPVDVQGVQRLNGFVSYLAKFLLGLLETLEPIRQLTRKDVPWNWGPAQEAVFKEMKDLVKEAPCLKYFDSKKPLVIQCDASEGGLGAAILQDGYPISYAGRTLTGVEVWHAQMEKEMLAIVFALEIFHQYTLARPMTVHSDHRPLGSYTEETSLQDSETPARYAYASTKVWSTSSVQVWERPPPDRHTITCLPLKVKRTPTHKRSWNRSIWFNT